MNRVVISVPRVLDSAVVVLHEDQCVINTGNLPSTAAAPFTVKAIKAMPAETQMQQTTVQRLSCNTNCSRVTADVSIPLTMTITDASGAEFETYSNVTRQIDIVLYIPTDAAFPYTITSEGVMECCGTSCAGTTTTLRHTCFKILTRVTAVTDLLIPSYGYAPLNPAENYYQSESNNFINQPLFPVGKVY